MMCDRSAVFFLLFFSFFSLLGPLKCLASLVVLFMCNCQLSHSGGASAAKEPGHFEVRTSSSQVTRMHFFPQKSWPFLVVALKTQRLPTPLRLFHCQN